METIVQKTSPLASAKVTIYCPECSKMLKINKIFAKRLALCPGCKTILTVPTHDVAPAQPKIKDGKKCPNCFEYNNPKVSQCVYCNEYMGKYEFKELCPNCKEEQDPKNQYCSKCGVNIKTGLADVAKKRACPRCGILSTGMEKVCEVCKTPFTASPKAIQAQKMLKSFHKTVSANMGCLFSLALLIGIGYIYTHRSDILGSLSSSYYGEKEAQLRSVLHQYTAALKYGDWETVSRMTIPSRALTYKDFPQVAGIDGEKDGTFYQLVECEISKVIVRDEEATVYADIAYKKCQVSESNRPSPTNSVEVFAELAKKLKQQTASPPEHVSWKWSFSNAEWKRMLR